MKKIFDKKTIVTIIISGIFFLLIGASAATLLVATDVSYTNTEASVTNVQEALDDLNIKTNTGNAISNQILTGKTALIQGKLIQGTMPNKSGWNITPTEKETITIPEGYHDGTGYVDLSNLSNNLSFLSSNSDINSYNLEIGKNYLLYLQYYQKNNITPATISNLTDVKTHVSIPAWGSDVNSSTWNVWAEYYIFTATSKNITISYATATNYNGANLIG